MPTAASSKPKNRLDLKRATTLTDGLVLAQDLISGRITPETFAKKFYVLKQAELFEFRSGLFTPSFFSADLILEIAQAKRSKDALCLVVLDVDKFKTLNDAFGHLAGDRVIQYLGKALLKCIRAEDVPCRWGGDEFAIITPNTEIKGAVALCRRILKHLNDNPCVYKKQKIFVTVSLGVTPLTSGDTPESLLDKADQAAYKGKMSGGNTVCVFEK